MVRLHRSAALLLLALLFEPPRAPAQAADAGWTRLPEILARIRAPQFTDRDFSIAAHGAVPDGRSDATAAFRAAIEACHRAGGGRVLVPPGDYLSGPIHLRSNVNLHVSAGATVRFSRNPDDYLPAVLTRWEGVELMNYSPLVYALDQENVAVTGQGTLDGQADAHTWWHWKRSDIPESQKPARDRLFRQAEDGVPVAQRGYGAGDYLSNAMRGGVIENVFVRDTDVGEVGNAIDIDMLYEEGAVGPFAPTVRNVRVERMSVAKAAYAFWLRGLEAAPIRDVSISESTFRGVLRGSRIQDVADLQLRNVRIEPAR
jgi:hypothetical protein